MDKLYNQFLGKLSITTEKSYFSKSVYVRRFQESNHQARNKHVLVGEKETHTKKNLRPFIINQFIIITPREYLKIILDADFGTNREISLLFHLY